MFRRHRPALLAGALALAFAVSSCSALKDPEPFQATITYEEGPAGTLSVDPLRIEGDTSFGEITVVNNTNQVHGFQIEELAVFDKIPKGLQKVIVVAEAKDDHTYTFDDQLHPGEFRGELHIDYVKEEERR